MALKSQNHDRRIGHGRQGGRPRILTIEAVKDAVEKCRGSVGATARMLRCDESTLYKFRRANPEVEEHFQAQIERRLDWVEGKLDDAIERDDIRAIIFFLRTKGKSRGYVERFESAGVPGQPVECKHSFAGQTNFWADVDSIHRELLEAQEAERIDREIPQDLALEREARRLTGIGFGNRNAGGNER